MAGEGAWELLERAGNYGVPLAFLLLLGPGRSIRDWVSSRPAPRLTPERAAAIEWTLRITTACLLIGHGAFDFAMRKDWSGYAAALGIAPATVAAHPLLGRDPQARSRLAERAAEQVQLPWPASKPQGPTPAWLFAARVRRPSAAAQEREDFALERREVVEPRLDGLEYEHVVHAAVLVHENVAQPLHAPEGVGHRT